jgi:hypothetical protein
LDFGKSSLKNKNKNIQSIKKELSVKKNERGKISDLYRLLCQQVEDKMYGEDFPLAKCL